jgi:hypothetical protein
MEFQRPRLLDDDGQRRAPAASCDLGKQRPQVRLAAEGPVGADDASLDITDLGENAFSDGFALRQRLTSVQACRSSGPGRPI